MKRLLHFVVCPACGADLDDDLACRRGHRYPIVHEVPRLVPGSAGEEIRESFTLEWERFDYARDRTWGQDVDTRVGHFLSNTDLRPSDLEGKAVLDAGCGNALLSDAITRFRCDVVATDISDSVFRAASQFAGNKRLR